MSSSNGDDGSDGSSSTRSTTSPGRNDNPGALNGVLPFYAMPDEILLALFRAKTNNSRLSEKVVRKEERLVTTVREERVE